MKPTARLILLQRRTSQFIRRMPCAKLSLACSLFLSLHSKSIAQCNTFINSDTSNPVLTALPSGQTLVSLDFADMDGDGKKDCYIVPAGGLPQLYRNNGGPERPHFVKSNVTGFENVSTMPAGSPVIQFVDIDADGDNDCFITEVNYGFRPVTSVRFFRNTGTRKRPQFAEDAASNPVDFAKSDNNFVQFTFADIDKDGDLDFYYTGFFNRTLGDYNQYTYLNKGTARQTNFALYTNDHPHDFERQRTYFDWNRDGLPDYIKFEPTLNEYEYMTNSGPLEMPVFAKGSNAPLFTNGMPFRLVDLNNDGTPEAFTASGHYSTIAPVASIAVTQKNIADIVVTQLASASQSPAYTYHWKRDGNNLTDSKPALTATRPGRYVLFVTNECGIGVSLPFIVNADSVAGSKTDFAASDISAFSATAVKAYPNPFKDEIKVRLPFSKAASTIRITDLAGRVMLVQATSSQIVLVGKHLSAGTYLLQVIQSNGVAYHATIMKQ